MTYQNAFLPVFFFFSILLYLFALQVLGMMPNLSMNVTTEVVDDEEQHVVTAGAIITVTVSITRSVHFNDRKKIFMYIIPTSDL